MSDLDSIVTPSETETDTESTISESTSGYATAEEPALPIPPPENLWEGYVAPTPLAEFIQGWQENYLQPLPAHEVDEEDDLLEHVEYPNEDSASFTTSSYDQGVQVTPVTVDRGVQTNLYASVTVEDITQLIQDLPADFWQTPSSVCYQNSDLPDTSDPCDDHRSPDLF